jgi:PKD repeat protein
MGNYWSDFDESSEGAYDNNTDGIVDAPYNISSDNNQDLYPLAGPWWQRPYQATLVSPSNGATGVSINPTLQVNVSDPNNDTMNVTFYASPGNTVIGTDTNVANGDTASVTWSSRSYSTSYNWYVIVNDSLYLTKSLTWSFTTESRSGNGGSSGGGGDFSGEELEEDDETDITNPPTADANGPYKALTFQSITFDGSGSSDNGTITNYSWTFGDGTTAYGVKPTHSYNESGLFNVTLTVTDDTDLTDSDTTTAKITLDTDGDGWSDDEEEYYGSNKTIQDDVPIDTDNDNLPDLDDEDDDNDGIKDIMEDFIGSNSKNGLDSTFIEIEGEDFYLIDINDDGIYDKLYNVLGSITDTKVTGNGKILLDFDGDSKWDYYYDPASSQITPYEEILGFDTSTLLIVLIIIIVILSGIVVLFKLGFFRFEKNQ